jgi:PilZ domain
MTMSTEETMQKRNPTAVTEGAVRAQRHELHIPLRYRLEGQQSWLSGEAINMSESGLLFSSNEMLEIDSRVQITFQQSETPIGRSGTRLVRVVRRILSNWPETRILFGAKFC